MKTVIYILYLICLIYIIFIAPSISKKFLNIFIQFFVLLVIFILTAFDSSLGVLLMLSYIITLSYIYYGKKVKENFDVVEDDLNKMIMAEQNSLLKRLQNQGENVEGVWSATVLAKEIGLNKA